MAYLLVLLSCFFFLIFFILIFLFYITDKQYLSPFIFPSLIYDKFSFFGLTFASVGSLPSSTSLIDV